MAAMTPADLPKEELTEEELKHFEARAKEYSRMKMAQHRAWQTDIDNKIRHKRAAIAALPEGYLRDAAMKEDHAMFPLVGSGEVGFQRKEFKGQMFEGVVFGDARAI